MTPEDSKSPREQLVMRCQMVLDYKRGEQFTAEKLANLIEAELAGDRALREALQEIIKNAEQLDGDCEWGHAEEFARIVKVARAALDKRSE